MNDKRVVCDCGERRRVEEGGPKTVAVGAASVTVVPEDEIVYPSPAEVLDPTRPFRERVAELEARLLVADLSLCTQTQAVAGLKADLAAFEALDAQLPEGYDIGDDATVPLALKCVELEAEVARQTKLCQSAWEHKRRWEKAACGLEHERDAALAEVAAREARCAEWLRRITAPIVCLCGSTRFMEAFFDAGWQLTLRDIIVLSVGVCKHAEHHGGEALGQDVADRLDDLHKRKIDLADTVFVLNVGGYIGESTAGEIAYAEATGVPVAYLEACDALDWDAVAQAVRECAALACPDLAAARLLAEAKVGRLAMTVRAASLDLRDTAPDIMNTAHSALWAECIAAMREAREAVAAEEKADV